MSDPDDPVPGGLPDLELEDSYSSMADLFRDADRNLDRLLAAHAAEGVVPSCRRGCDACCHQLVLATVAEAKAAAEHLRAAFAADPAAEVAARDRLATWHDRTAPLRSRLQAAVEVEDLEPVVEGIATDYWRERPPCPFLVDHACGIYEARPLACRHHLAVGDPARCADPETEGVDRPTGADEAFFFAQEAIPEDQAEIGIFPELVGLFLEPEP